MFTGLISFRHRETEFLPKDTIDPFLCTIVIYTSDKIHNQNKIAPYEWKEDGLYAEVYNIKQKNIELKMLLAVKPAQSSRSKLAEFAREHPLHGNKKCIVSSLVCFFLSYKNSKFIMIDRSLP